MNKITGIFIFVLLLFGCRQIKLMAQPSDELMEMALTHFGDTGNSVWWLKDLSGYLDHTHAVRMVLATDNKVFKGAYEILSSKEKFYLDGNHDGDQIVLVESDSLGRTTGIIRGDMNDDKFYCEWSDVKNMATLPLFLFRSSPSEYPCGNVGWSFYFKAEGTDSLKYVTAAKMEDQLFLTLHYPSTDITHDLECMDDGCNIVFHLPQTLDDQSEYQLDLQNNTLMAIQDTSEVLYRLKVVKKIYFDCSSFMDFDDKFSFVYPLGTDQKFNEYIQSAIVEKYSAGNYSHKRQENCSLSDRINHEEYGSFLIDYFDDKMISGLFVIQSSKFPQATEIPFTFLFEKSISIAPEILFVPNFDLINFISTYVQTTKNQRGESDAFAQQTASQYELITFSRKGLLVRSKFNTIYGRDEITVPYDELRPHFIKKPILKL